jgi:hypothetical protein
MSESDYVFKEIINLKQIEIIIAAFRRHEIYGNCDFAVYLTICEILYKNGFREVYFDRIYNHETNCHFKWDTLINFKTVVDFQLACHFS